MEILAGRLDVFIVSGPPLSKLVTAEVVGIPKISSRLRVKKNTRRSPRRLKMLEERMKDMHDGCAKTDEEGVGTVLGGGVDRALPAITVLGATEMRLYSREARVWTGEFRCTFEPELISGFDYYHRCCGAVNDGSAGSTGKGKAGVEVGFSWLIVGDSRTLV